VGMTPVPTVSFGGTPATNVIVSAGPTITCTAPAAGVAGGVNVTVTTPGGVSNVVTYTYRNIPTVTSISPTAGPLSGGNTVTIYGTGFGVGMTPVPTVSFGGTPATNVIVSAGPIITCTAPAAGIAGSVSVTVTTPGGTSNAVTYSY
ncbi:MAG: IPT/TIG domain-containing protein, partial [Methanoregula sp.]